MHRQVDVHVQSFLRQPLVLAWTLEQEVERVEQEQELELQLQLKVRPVR